jgi:hypothetical protein
LLTTTCIVICHELYTELVQADAHPSDRRNAHRSASDKRQQNMEISDRPGFYEFLLTDSSVIDINGLPRSLVLSL